MIKLQCLGLCACCKASLILGLHDDSGWMDSQILSQDENKEPDVGVLLSVGMTPHRMMEPSSCVLFMAVP